jgi:hypothetical protein
LREEEADWLERHKGTDIKMRTNRGDCGWKLKICGIAK